MLKSYNTKGFTLIELMVAVALMLILISTVVQIFMTSSLVFNRAEARIAIYLNGRAALQKIGTEVAGAFPYNDNPDSSQQPQEFVINNLDSTNTVINWKGRQVNGPSTKPLWRDYDNSREILTFFTTTSWVDNGETYTIGAAKVVYQIQETHNRLVLRRRLFQPNRGTNDSINGQNFESDVCQYIAGMSNNTYCRFVVQWKENAADSTFSDGPRLEPNPPTLPQALRITMDLTDEFSRELRTISRVIWIPTAE